MGLQEKRRIQHIQENLLPTVAKQVSEISGHASLDWFINWQHLDKNMQAVENIEKIGLPRIVEVFRNVCVDDLGKECVRKALKRVDLIHSEDPSERVIQFVEWTLTVQGNWAEASAEGWPEVKVIQETLEAGL
jgi:hypothetical protein